ncbi:MAG TPA: NAD-dependent DNA ligase LigA [Verrucomicrobiota bacterium]|nr:NAD-dependent DNA ligase LigA [Verrucomicrobiota bacterium]
MNSDGSTNSRLSELRRLIDQADEAYYTRGQALVEDALYDQWKDELAQLAPDDPRLKRVGARLQEAHLQKRQHTIPMGSLAKAVNHGEFLKWVKGIGAEGKMLHASYKMDGGSFSFEFRDGCLVAAISRGDGLAGEDITANALKFRGIPAQCRLDGHPFTGFMRGEVILPTEDWSARVDPDALSNPRNCCVGIARRKNGQQSELLKVFAFRAFGGSGQPLCTTETEQTQAMRNIGFECAPSFTGTAEAVWDWYVKTQQERPKLPYWIDGIVVKLDNIAEQLSLGESDQRPKGQVALKFEAEGAETTIRRVSISVGHTGCVVPTAAFDPVQIGGTTVSSATLCNWDNIRQLNVGIGDKVRVIKAGDIIPRILELVEKSSESTVIPEPACCPACQGKVGRRSNVSGDDSTALYCLNPECSAKLYGKIERYLSSLDIVGVGENLIQSLIQEMAVKDAADLYTLKNRRDELAALRLSGGVRLGEKRADKFLAEVEKRRRLTLSQLLGSLGIFGLGKRRVALIQQAVPGEFNTLNDWLSDKLIRLADQAGVPNIGRRLQEDLLAQKLLIRKFLEAGVEILGPEVSTPGNKPDGYRFCITGALSRPKSHFEQLIRAKGHGYTDTFSKDVTHLVSADPNSGSSKLQKAKKAGIPVISEAEFLALLDQT